MLLPIECEAAQGEVRSEGKEPEGEMPIEGVRVMDCRPVALRVRWRRRLRRKRDIKMELSLYRGTIPRKIYSDARYAEEVYGGTYATMMLFKRLEPVCVI